MTDDFEKLANEFSVDRPRVRVELETFPSKAANLDVILSRIQFVAFLGQTATFLDQELRFLEVMFLQDSKTVCPR